LFTSPRSGGMWDFPIPINCRRWLVAFSEVETSTHSNIYCVHFGELTMFTWSYSAIKRVERVVSCRQYTATRSGDDRKHNLLKGRVILTVLLWPDLSPSSFAARDHLKTCHCHQFGSLQRFSCCIPAQFSDRFARHRTRIFTRSNSNNFLQ
jgi:hypothetical protein